VREPSGTQRIYATRARRDVSALAGRSETGPAAIARHRTSDDSLDWLAVRIGMLGGEFEAHEPPELVDCCAALGGRFARGAERR